MAWLILAVASAVPPDVVAPPVNLALPANPEGPDPCPEKDGVPAKDEAIPYGSGLLQKRAHHPHGPNARRSLRSARHHRASPRPPRDGDRRCGAGHFLGEARLLRHWIQSLLF